MWWRDGLNCCSDAKNRQSNHQIEALLPTTQHESPPNDGVSPCPSMMFSSWLSRRRQRCLFVILCIPFLLPLVCAACPFLFAIEICSRVCRRRRRRRKTGENCGGDTPSRSGEELLLRYLEDQLRLVMRSGKEKEDDDENAEEKDGVNVQYSDVVRPLLQ